MRNASSTPSALSSSGNSGSPVRSSALACPATRATVSGEVTFGSRTPPSPWHGSSVLRSARPSGEDGQFTRTCTGTGGCSASSSAVASRAYSLRAGATASSRSTSTTSAPARSALATTSGRSPGTYSKVSGGACTSPLTRSPPVAVPRSPER